MEEMEVDDEQSNQNSTSRRFTRVVYKMKMAPELYTEVEYFVPPGYEPNRVQRLGTGTSGTHLRMYANARNGTAVDVVVKKFSDPFEDKMKAARAYREMALLAQLRHPNIIHAIDIFTPDRSAASLSRLFLTMSYAGRTLQAVMKQQSQPDYNPGPNELPIAFKCRVIIYEILRALKYLHSANVIHRDVRPANVALGVKDTVKLLNFGQARVVPEDEDNPAPTAYVYHHSYRAPEVTYRLWDDEYYTTSADMWSVGCILGELLTGRRLFDGSDITRQQLALIGPMPRSILDTTHEGMSRSLEIMSRDYARNNMEITFEQAVRALGSPNADIDVEGIKMLECLLEFDPEERSTASDALKLPYLDEVRIPESEAEDKYVGRPIDDGSGGAATPNLDAWKHRAWDFLIQFERSQQLWAVA